MCDEAKALLFSYLDALEEYDRLHLMFLATYKRNDREAAEGYRRLLLEGQFKLNGARDRFQQHQASHGCCEALHFEGFGGGRSA